MPLSHSQTLEGFGCGGAGGGGIVRSQCHKRKIDVFGNVHPEEMLDAAAVCNQEPQASLPKRHCQWPHQESQFQESPQESLPGCLKDEPSLPPETLRSLTLSSSFLSSSLPQSLLAPLPRNLASNNLANHFLSCIQRKREEEEQQRQQESLNSSRSQQADMESEEINMDEDKDLSSADHKSNFLHNNNSEDDNGNRNGLTFSLGNPEVMEANSSMDSDCVPDAAQYKSTHSSIRPSPPQNIAQDKDKRGMKPSPVSGRLYCHCSASWRGMYGLDTGYITDYY